MNSISNFRYDGDDGEYGDDQEEEKEDAWGSTPSGPVQSNRDQPLSLPAFCSC